MGYNMPIYFLQISPVIYRTIFWPDSLLTLTRDTVSRVSSETCAVVRSFCVWTVSISVADVCKVLVLWRQRSWIAFINIWQWKTIKLNEAKNFSNKFEHEAWLMFLLGVPVHLRVCRLFKCYNQFEKDKLEFMFCHLLRTDMKCKFDLCYISRTLFCSTILSKNDWERKKTYRNTWLHHQNTPNDRCKRRNPQCWNNWRQHDSCFQGDDNHQISVRGNTRPHLKEKNWKLNNIPISITYS